MTPGLTIEQTTNRKTLRRWMLDPDVLRGACIGLPPKTCEEIERDFKQTVNPYTSNVFWLVNWQREERGIVMMTPVSEGWKPHLCLKTQRPHTREVMRELFRKVAGTTIIFNFCILNERMGHLADDLGFGPPQMRIKQPQGATAPWFIRTLRV
jgi:hypothetical protein